jgi:hypothetical protein
VDGKYLKKSCLSKQCFFKFVPKYADKFSRQHCQNMQTSLAENTRLDELKGFGLHADNEEPEQLIRYTALIHNSVMTSTEKWETSCLVNDAFGTTWLFQDVNDVASIVFHHVVGQRHLLRWVSRRHTCSAPDGQHWAAMISMWTQRI